MQPCWSDVGECSLPHGCTKVSVESAKLDEMADFLVVDSGHTFIMNDPEVIRQIDLPGTKNSFPLVYLHVVQ